jgi:hypothetical protein
VAGYRTFATTDVGVPADPGDDLEEEPVTIASWDGRRYRLPPYRPHPCEQLPPMAPLEELRQRAHWRAEAEWREERGSLPWELPLQWLDYPADRRVYEELRWPDRWFREHLFELPPLGQVPQRWLDYFTPEPLEEVLL